MHIRLRGFCAGSLLIVGNLGAQSTIVLTDSITRQIASHSAESLFVSLRDGDYAKFVVTHPAGVTVDVIRPSGAQLRRFITSGVQGTNPIQFVAEGAGRYAVVIANVGEHGVQYNIVFREHRPLDDRTRAVRRRNAVTSPRIEAMRRQVDSGNRNSAAFWDATSRDGTPFVEQLDARYDLVTFVWRAEVETRSVHVTGPFAVPGVTDYAMDQLDGTDIWYLSLPLPKGARFTYQLEPNRPTVPGVARVTGQADPFNHRMKWDCPSGASKYQCSSIVELPEAPPQPWVEKRANVPVGRIERGKIHSALQNVDRDLTVYTPASYVSKGRAASLLILFDGDEYLDSNWHGPDTWDNLVAAARIPPTVVVMVHNLPNRRLFDLVANPTFGDFMARELLPWVWAHYNVSHDPRRTVVGGASAGGFAATYLGLAHPEVFGNVLSMSGAFWWSPEHNGGICAGACAAPGERPAVVNRDGTTEPNWLAQLALKRPASQARFYLAAGTFEFDLVGSAGGILEETRHLRDILLAKNYQVIYQQFVGGHDDLSWRGMMADGLEKLLGPAR